MQLALEDFMRRSFVVALLVVLITAAQAGTSINVAGGALAQGANHSTDQSDVKFARAAFT
jgi:hypothetical protein